MNFEDIASKLLYFRQTSLGTGADKNEIEDASRTLEAPISGGYMQFLQRFGWARVTDFGIYGLGGDVPLYLNLVVITMSERIEMEPPLPAHLLPIMNNGGGDLVCLDTSANANEPPVVTWWHEDGPDQVPEQTATDFVSWLSSMLKERMGGL